MEKESVIDILLVDDDPDDTELTTHALLEGNKSIHLKHLSNGIEALEFIFGEKDQLEQTHHENLKLILMDLKLPKMDGLEVLKKIRENRDTCHLPVVILTSSRERKDIIRAYKMGANSFVVKPVGFDSYVKVVSALSYYWNEINVPPVPWEPEA